MCSFSLTWKDLTRGCPRARSGLNAGRTLAGRRSLRRSAPRALSLPGDLAPGGLDRLFDPGAEGRAVLEDVGGELVVLHHVGIAAVGTERPRPDSLELRAGRVVHLEIEGVVIDQAEEEPMAVETHPAEHRL